MKFSKRNDSENHTSVADIIFASIFGLLGIYLFVMTAFKAATLGCLRLLEMGPGYRNPFICYDAANASDYWSVIVANLVIGAIIIWFSGKEVIRGVDKYL